MVREWVSVHGAAARSVFSAVSVYSVDLAQQQELWPLAAVTGYYLSLFTHDPIQCASLVSPHSS
jgi:hypothetical protein